MATFETIKRGSQGEAVKALQRVLHLQEDGIFGKMTDEAVREYQAWNGLTVDGVVGPRTWKLLLADQQLIGGRETDDGFVVRGVNLSAVRATTRRTINEIIIHCTATPEGKDYGIDEVTKWHKQRGFTTIGYHYLIGLDGKIRNGRNIDVAGAHCVGHNSHSVGVCYVGGCEADGKTAKDTRTEAQKKSLLALTRRLCQLYPKAKIYGHRELSRDQNGDGLIESWEWEKQCPSFDVKEIRLELKEQGVYKR